jgi:DNA polymerase III subunit delta
VASLSPQAVRAQIARGAPDPVYLLIGDDEAELSELAADLSALVPDDLRAFNVDRLHASDKSLKPDAIVAAARTFSMLGDRRVVLVLRAERWLNPKRKGKGEEAGGDDGEDASPVDSLVNYLREPELATTLVFVATDANRSLKLYKALQKHATIVECWGLRGSRDAKINQALLRDAARQAEQIVKSSVAKAGQQIEPAAARLLAERAGVDIGTLRADLERLLLYAAGKSKIEVADVREVVSAETAQDDWAVTNAIERGDAAEALRQVALSLDAGTAPEQMLGQIGWFVRDRMGDVRRVPAAVDALFRTDQALKSTRAEARVLMERLVIELCRR